MNINHMSKHSGKVYLVTGAAGLLGSAVVNLLLNQGAQVRAMVHRTPLSITHDRLESVTADLLDVIKLAEALEGVTHVFHCAAMVSFQPADAARVMRLNVQGTANVVNACLDAGIQKLVHVSSVAALGRLRKEVVTEEMYWTKETSNSIYGESKYLAELEVYRGAAEGLPMVIVNPSIILGGNNWDDGSGALFKSVYNGFKWYSRGVSGFVDVEDVARAMVMLMDSNIFSQRFILNGENASYERVFKKMAACFGVRAPYREVTPFLASLVWRLEAVRSFFTGKKHLVTRETARTSLARVTFANSKILAALPGFSFTPLEETISRTCGELQERYLLQKP